MSRSLEKYFRSRPEVGLLVSLLEAYSPSGRTGEALEVLTGFLEERGLQPRIDEHGTLTCRLEGEPKVLICGHIDTVPGRLPVVMRGDVVSGRGAVDAKSPLSASAVALARFAEKGGRGVMFAVVSDEESEGGEGTRALIGRLPGTLRWGIVAEPTRGRGVAVSYHGRLAFRLDVRGRPMHASACIRFRNPIESCFQAYSAVKSSVLDLLGETPICPTIVEGGGHRGLMPESCSMYVDIRIPPGFTVKQVMDVVERAVAAFRGDRLEYHVEWCGFEEPFSVDPENPLVKVFTGRIRKIMGEEPLLIRKLGTSDFNLIGRGLGIPVVAYGPGNPRLSHTDIERVSIREYLASIDVLEAVLEELTVV